MRKSYMNSFAVLSLAAALVVYPRRAEAYCLLPTSGYMSSAQSPVAVYLNSNASKYYGNIGVPAATMDEWTRAAIDEINMASHGGPKLYFAGYITTSTSWASYPLGITIESYGSCTDQNIVHQNLPDNQAYFAVTSTTSTRSKIRMARGGTYACDGQNDHPALQGYYWWVDPDDDDDNKNTNHDFVGVLVHEIGHSLGLHHPDQITINSGACANNSPAAAYASVMHPGNKDFRRRLRGDDIEGLREIYGEPERSLIAAKNVTSGATFGSWGTQSAVGSLVINTPPTVSDAARDDESYLQVAATNAADELFYVLGTSSSVSSTGTYVTSGAGTSGVRVRSYDPVAIARGLRSSDNAIRLAVAWLGAPDSAAGLETDDRNDPDNRIWWKVFPSFSTGWLAPKSTSVTKYKELGLSYDPAQDLFLLVYIDTYPYPSDPDVEYPSDSWVFARTIDASTGNSVCTQALTTAEHVLHVGSPACDVRSGLRTRCHIPVVTTEDSGPVFRVLEGAIDEHPSVPVYCWLRDAEPNPPPLTTSEKSFGPLWMAMDGATTNGVALFSHVPGLSTTTPSNSDYSELFTMTRNGSGLLTGTISQRKRMRSDYWPIAVGSLARTTSPVTVWWAVTGY